MFIFLCVNNGYAPFTKLLSLTFNISSMTIHKEGYKIIAWSTIIFGAVNILFFYFLSFEMPLVTGIVFTGTFGFLLFIFSFFRVPKRTLTIREDAIVAPADGKVVAIEEIQADEYFTDRRIQVSIFMSPLNVHLRRNPVRGEVTYSRYHKGKYLVAWHPKSSTENERHSVV